MMKHLKRLLCVGVSVVAAMTGSAANPVITVKTADNRTVRVEVTKDEDVEAGFVYDFELEKIKLQVTQKMAVNDDENDPDQGNILLDMPVIDISSVEFDYESGINEVAGDVVAINVTDGVISFTGIETPVNVDVWSANGIAEYSAEICGGTTIDLSRFGNGIHIVSVNGTTFKIMTK